MDAIISEVHSTMTSINGTVASLASDNTTAEVVAALNGTVHALASINDVLCLLTCALATPKQQQPTFSDAKTWMEWFWALFYFPPPMTPLCMWIWFVGYHLHLYTYTRDWIRSYRKERVREEDVECMKIVEGQVAAGRKRVVEARKLQELAETGTRGEKFADLAARNLMHRLEYVNLAVETRIALLDTNATNDFGLTAIYRKYTEDLKAMNLKTASIDNELDAALGDAYRLEKK